MEMAQFERMVARLETSSQQRPWLYIAQVIGLVLLGFVILLAMTGLAGLVLLAAVGGLIWVLAVGPGAVWLLVAKLGKLLIFALIPLWMLLQNSFKALLIRLPAPQGRALSRQEAPALFQALDDMRQRMKGPRFHHVLLVDDVNAAVVQRPAFGLMGFPRNYLLLGLPLLEAMTPDEALAVVAHEYGHLSGAHGRFGAFIYRLRLTWSTVQAHVDAWQGRMGKLPSRLVGWYAPYFNAYTYVLARQQEYQADAAAAELVGLPAAQSALKRSNVAMACHSAFMDKTIETVRLQAQPPGDLAVRWAQEAAAEQAASPRWLSDALDRQPNPLDTHPTLRQRLRALGVPDEDLSHSPDTLTGPSAAQVWLGEQLPQLREAQQAAWRDAVNEGWTQQHQSWVERRKALAELLALEERNSDQALEVLRLQLNLEPEADHREGLAAFNAAHPDHALGQFLEGVARLDREDDSGLANLERAIALDADATKGASEKAWRYLLSRDAAAAEAWAQRWRDRDAWEQERARQVDTLSDQEVLLAPTLSAEARAQAATLMSRHTHGVKRAWLARRQIAADPNFETYVIVLELTAWASFRSKGPEIVQALAKEEWPFVTHLCLLKSFPGYKAKVNLVGDPLLR